MEKIFNGLGVGLTWLVTIIGALLAAFWIGLIIWTWHDIRSRSADIFAALLAVVLVAVFNVLGLLIYLLVRPKFTLAEQYDRALEEEILLRDLEQSPTCHQCGRPVKQDWRYCPHCEALLKQPCASCGYLLEPGWKRCPSCGESTSSVAPAPVVSEPVIVTPPPAASPPPLTTSGDEPLPEEPDLSETVVLSESEAIAKAEALGLLNED
jgi:RNA polymerase subunit RPABC4/transcription elongation factor Spt4